MPCFSASNLRSSVEQKQIQGRPGQTLNGNSERAKTASILSLHEGAFPRPSVNVNDMPKSIQRQCEELFLLKGYGAQDLLKHKRNVQRSKALKQKGKKAQQTTLPQKELERLKAASKVITLEDRLEALAKQEAETKRLEMEAEETREHFKKLDDKRKKAQEAYVEKEDLFGAGEKIKVLERAFLAKHEQEEEVKRVNRIILNAKCHAVRDAQIQEKIELEREMRNEEIRLEQSVLDKAIQSLNEEDEKVNRQNLDKQKYAQEIKKQLNERQNLRFLEAERLEQEARMHRKANDALKRDDERQAKLAKERQQKFKAELVKIAEMANLFKRMLCEQEQEADMKVAAYMREKQQRERELQIEKKLAKEEFERKQQRLFTLAQKILESKSQREELSYIREQEKMEREYRRKEKAAVQRKRQIEKDLAEARERQLQETKHRQALQIARAEKDFNHLIERLKREEEKQRKEDDAREQRSKCYRRDIIRQMNDKEIERRRLQELEATRASAWRESERQRDANIRAVINAKMAAMSDACLPEKYIKEVEKQLQKIIAK